MTETPAPAEALSLLLDRYTDAYHNLGEAMDAREWPDDSPLPIMTDWQRARRDQFNAARIALEKALPDLVRERAALLTRAEEAEAEVKRLRGLIENRVAHWERMARFMPHGVDVSDGAAITYKGCADELRAALAGSPS